MALFAAPYEVIKQTDSIKVSQHFSQWPCCSLTAHVSQKHLRLVVRFSTPKQIHLHSRQGQLFCGTLDIQIWNCDTSCAQSLWSSARPHWLRQEKEVLPGISSLMQLLVLQQDVFWPPDLPCRQSQVVHLHDLLHLQGPQPLDLTLGQLLCQLHQEAPGLKALSRQAFHSLHQATQDQHLVVLTLHQAIQVHLLLPQHLFEQEVWTCLGYERSLELGSGWQTSRLQEAQMKLKEVLQQEHVGSVDQNQHQGQSSP